MRPISGRKLIAIAIANANADFTHRTCLSGADLPQQPLEALGVACEAVVVLPKLRRLHHPVVGGAAVLAADGGNEPRVVAPDAVLAQRVPGADPELRGRRVGGRKLQADAVGVCSVAG